MTDDLYKAELENLKAKIDKNYYLIDESLPIAKHKMFVEGNKTKRNFTNTFKVIKDECFALEKVELIDYWNIEDGRKHKTR